MNRCTRCVMPDTRPDTAFVNGVCSACLSYERSLHVDWDTRKQELLALLDRHDGRCIVPSSGGKDSTYQAVTLKELGADATVVTARTCMLTEIGRKNIDNLARLARTIEVVPDMTQAATLNRLGLELVGDISWREHVAIFSTPFRMSVSLGLPLIFYGENPQNQYGGPMGSEEARQMTRRWTQEFGGFLGLRPSDVAAMGYDMRDYELPSQEAMGRVGVEAHFLGQYIPWDSHRNAYVAKAHGFQCRLPSPANWWDHENQDNAQTGLHDHMMFLKYGYGRGCAQISVDIRAGLISRDEALTWVHEHDGSFPNEYMGVPFEAVLEHIGMAMEQFRDIKERFTNYDVFWERVAC